MVSFNALFSITQLTSEFLDTALTHLRRYQWHTLDLAIAGIIAWTLLRWFHLSRQQVRTTRLRGPPSESFLYGVGKYILDSDDAGSVYESWAYKYGPVYAVPSTMLTKRIILCDPKAIAHFYSKDTWSYIQTPFIKETQAMFIGKGLLWSHGEDHRRQRKTLTPAFSIAAIRQLTPIFYDSAYKVKAAWDALIESSDSDSAIIEVQDWMNHISLDTIGLAGFSHNFGSLEGKHTDIIEILDTFGASPRSSALNTGLLVLGELFPFLARVPTRRTRLRQKLTVITEKIFNALVARTKKEMEISVAEGKGEKSVIGLLIKGSSMDSQFHLTKEEVMAQMNLLLLAGYETTSISLTWALLELSRHPDVQTKLRNELLEHGADATYDQLTNCLPYLDAVVHEILRLYPPVPELTRIAIEDDVMPLSQPVRTMSGEMVDSLTIAKGTLVTISMECINRSAAIWGEDAKIFRPGRWLEDVHGQDGIPTKAKEVPGHRHLLTFVDGPRMCLGKNFAVTEFKSVLTVLIKSYVFELRDGVDSKIEIGRGLLPRPHITGEVGCRLPLRVRPYVA